MYTRRPASALSTFLVCLLMTACSKEVPTAPPPADDWTQEKLLNTLERQLWRVESVFRKSTLGTMDLATDSTFSQKDYISFRKMPLLWFRQGYVQFYISQQIPNTQFADSVETVSALTKVSYPTDATYAWDEAKKNVVFSTRSVSSSNLKIPLNQSAVIDKSSIRVYKTMEEAQAAKAHENLTITAEGTDPVLGKVTYIFNLKPAWQYGGLGDLNYTYYYAIF